jgi:hypothetical protein
MALGNVEQAAYNNALWCDAVCSTHHGQGEFSKSHWLNRRGVPRYYPDLVTLTGFGDTPIQTKAISDLVVSSSRRGWAIKDSFRCLELCELGFEPLFDAEWLSAIALSSNARQISEDLQWARVANETDLVRWEEAWRAPDGEAERPRTFKRDLLLRPDIHIIYALADGAPVGGGILNVGAGVVGLSNLFSGINRGAIWNGLSRIAMSMFPGLPLVTYEHGDNLSAAHAAGFSTIGCLRIWHRPMSDAN